MPEDHFESLNFDKESVSARFIAPSGEVVEKLIEIRTNPITRRTCRIAYSRIDEKEAGTDRLPQPPPDANNTSECPFCRPGVNSKTPQLLPEISPERRLVHDESILFPNLFPYGSYSAVSLFDNQHFVEIGQASLSSYTGSFLNCSKYFDRVLSNDPDAIYMAITQNHLPSAGGSLLHPHLQINADRLAPNHHRFIGKRALSYYNQTGACLFSDYLAHEKKDGSRYIGNTGAWQWVASFAPEGFFEIWGIFPQKTSFRQLADSDWQDLAKGVLNTQRFYRSFCRNGYNLGVLFIEDEKIPLELRMVILARSNYAPWVRNDHTGFEVMLGDMTTFTAPEETAEKARPFWRREQPIP
ncbi:MAG: galactose-1-phosphate uridylyltransferase [Thermodesulfobacteriota bacterium]|nr:galactose-1-phosphate uridylyltransferase [Thermodesulfobacteriota bacterium]